MDETLNPHLNRNADTRTKRNADPRTKRNADARSSPPPDPRVDRSRAAVYLAEDHVAVAMDSRVPVVLADGTWHRLPPPLIFGTIEAMQRYADDVLAHPGTRELRADPGRVQVVSARGFRRATYRAGIITIPAANRRGQWAMRDTVLLHELAHHLADAHGHGPAFRTALIHLYRVHVDPGAAQFLARGFQHIEGLPDPDSAPPPGRGDQLRRVAALLAKAESTTHPEEAETYLARAATLAQRHSIDLAVAAHSTSHASDAPTRRMISIGEPRRTINARFVALLLSIARAWGVRVDIGPSSTYVIVYGMPGDLDQVESVFATASTMMVSHAAAHVRSESWRGSSYWSSNGRRPVTAGVARNAFCLGFTERLGERVAEAQATARREAAAASGPPGDAGSSAGPASRPWHAANGVAHPTRDAQTAGGATASGDATPTGDATTAGLAIELALRHRESVVTKYHQQTSKARGTWRGVSGGSWSATGSRAAGERAANAFGAASLGHGRRALGGGSHSP